MSWSRRLLRLLGATLRLADRAAGLAIVGGALYLGGVLLWRAFTESPALLLLAIPALLSAAVLLPGLLRGGRLGLSLEWPWRRPRRHVRAARRGADGDRSQRRTHKGG